MRTYSRKSTPRTVNSESSEESSSSKRKSIPEDSRDPIYKPTKRAKKTVTKAPQDAKVKQKSLTQLHFCIDQSVIRKCALCGMSYTKGAKEDMELHRVHCNRVQKGLEWGREEEKEGYGTSITEVQARAKLKNGSLGRVICVPAQSTGRIGVKLLTLLETVNLYLSAPALEQYILQGSKVYLFLVADPSNARVERIAGCVVAQHISVARAVIPPTSALPEPDTTSPDSTKLPKPIPGSIDIGGIFCSTETLPTPMGISRIFVPSAFRRLGIARHLLDAAASTFIPGCVLDPKEGQVAFSQPTGDGARTMQSWGCVRVYEE